MTGPGCAIAVRTKRVPDTPENYNTCMCPKCPTYDQCMIDRKERLYCSKGTTGCEVTRLGCVCGECSIAIKYALALNYYCDEKTARY